MSKKQLEKQENKALEAIAEYNASIDALIDNLQKCKMDTDGIPKIINMREAGFINMREAGSRAEQYGIGKTVSKLWDSLL